MKYLLGMLALGLLASGLCVAQTTDAEVERRRQEAEAVKRQIEEARRRDQEKALSDMRQGIQPPIYRYPPSPVESARPNPPPSSTELARMLAEAAELERSGKGPSAVKLYALAARNGSGKAALRLGEIYSNGIPGVERDYAHSLRWYHAAHLMGEEVPKKKP